MKTNIIYFAVISVILLSCAAKKTVLTQRNLDSSNNLKRYCELNKIQSRDIALADSLMAESAKSLREGKDDEAFWQSDMAETYYKMGITRQQLNDSRKKMTSLKKSLAENQEHLTSLMEVYEEIKSLRR